MAAGCFFRLGCVLFALPLQPDSLPHLPDHLFQQWFYLLPRFGVDGVDLTLALGVGGGIASLVEVVVDLVDAAGAGFADFAGVGGEFGGVGLGDGGWFGRLGGYGTLVVGDAAVDEIGGVLAHGVGDVAVDVDGGGGADVTDDGGQGLDVHAVLQGGGSERVAEVVEPNILAPGPLQGLFHFAVDALRVDGALPASGWEHPFGVRPLS